MQRVRGGESDSFPQFTHFFPWIFLLLGLVLFATRAWGISVTAISPIEVGRTAATFVGTVAHDMGEVTANFAYGTTETVLGTQTVERSYVLGPQATSINQFVSGLQCNTTYFYRFQARNQVESLQSATISFTTLPCVTAVEPIITTDSPDPANITRSSAVLAGSISTGEAYTSVSYYFEYGLNTNYGMQTEPAEIRSSSTIQESVDASIFDLTCGTDYHFRLLVDFVGTDGTEETRMGENVGFSTEACATITIFNTSDLSVTNTTAVLRGLVNSPQEDVDIHFAYGLTRDLELTSPAENFTAGSITMTGFLTDLECNSTYYYALVVIAGDQLQQSSTKTFTTEPCSSRPSITTLEPKNILTDSATFRAAVSANNAATDVSFQWGLSQSLEEQTTFKTINDTLAGQFVEIEVAGLNCDTEYFIRALATNENGEVQGTIESFKTLACSDPIPDPGENPGGKPPITIAISAGANHTLALGNSGEVLVWGSNSFGQLGAEVTDFTLVDGLRASSVTPEIFTGFVDVAAGVRHSLIVNEQGDVYSFGDNSKKQLGIETEGTQARTPVFAISAQSSAHKVIGVDAGDTHSIALTETGLVFAWGDNSLWQLANPTLTNTFRPEVVNGLSDIVAISAGLNFNLVIKNDGTIFAWGDNEFGQIGNDSYQAQFLPQVIQGLTDIKAIATGDHHALALRADGVVYSWGSNTSGQLGRSAPEKNAQPVQVDSPREFGGLDNAIAVAAGSSHSLAILDDNTLVAWGDNSRGQLGIADSASMVSVPTLVVDDLGQALSDVVLVDAGEFFSVAVTEDGEIFTWGDNSKTQLNGMSSTQTFSQLKSANGIDISLNTPHIVLERTSVEVAVGETIRLQVRLSSAPSAALELNAEMEAVLGVWVETGSQLTFTPDNWQIPQTITLNTQSVEKTVSTNLLFSAVGLESLSLPISVKDNSKPLPPRGVGAISTVELLFISLFCFMSLLARKTFYQNQFSN